LLQVAVGDAFLAALFVDWAAKKCGPFPIKTLSLGAGATLADIYRGPDNVTEHFRLIQDVIFRFFYTASPPHLKVSRRAWAAPARCP